VKANRLRLQNPFDRPGWPLVVNQATYTINDSNSGCNPWSPKESRLQQRNRADEKSECSRQACFCAAFSSFTHRVCRDISPTQAPSITFRLRSLSRKSEARNQEPECSRHVSAAPSHRFTQPVTDIVLQLALHQQHSASFALQETGARKCCRQA